MIRINLLPLRASKKKETVRQQISILVLSVVGVLVVAGALYFLTVTKIATAKQQIDSDENELKALKSKIGAIDNLKKLQAEVKKKLDVLNQLRKEKIGPANRLAALSDAVPEKLWLTRYTENGPNVTVSGMAFSEDLIAQFMRNLQNSGAFSNVELQVSEQAEFGGVKGKKFDLSFVIATKKPDTNGKPEGAGKPEGNAGKP
ncbi:PilN domain-containing protein [Geomesophilobacter sediminis]|uniref:PilN domain-containing protein n=1 Tax=Geomesophilobacter sediminis TaxID=2798584 RepID=A0A8J7M2C0_9BACT|nr:PilN domain-containing protein [Geomesophilobacter sediminis]MBJ6727448.1 PilN domain-containing protein [Geomesophilobacter sediminis]